MSWGKIDPRGGIFVKYIRKLYISTFSPAVAWGQGPGVTKMLLNQLFSCWPHSTLHTVHQTPVPSLPGPRVSFWWSTGDGQFTNTQARSCKYLRVRAIVVPDRCQDDMSWGQECQDTSAGPGPTSPHFLLISCVACQCQCLCRAFLEICTWQNHNDWPWLDLHHSQFYFGYCLIICDVGHVGAVMWRGPREQVWGAAGEAGLMPAFVSISDTKSQNTLPTTHKVKHFCLNWFQMSLEMETLIEILMFLTLVHKGPFTLSSVLTFFNLRTLAGDKEKLF